MTSAPAGATQAAATVRLFSTLAAKGVLDELAPRYERTGGGRIAIVFEATLALLRRIEAGETADAAILTGNAVAGLLQAGILAAGSRVDLARSRIGVAVRAGTPKPDIGSVDALTRMLLGARVAYSREGASGIFFARSLQRLGIAEQVNARACIIPSGFAAESVARGEANVAVQQISELLVIPGVELVGALPEAVQSVSVFSGAVFRAAGNPADARALLGFLAAPGAAAAYARNGLEPVNA